ncbi:MAG: hypothetical protein ACYTHM_09450 [Planctomycetota bacterium]
MSEAELPAKPPQGFFRRHIRFFLILGGVLAGLLLILIIVAAVILFKASRVFPHPIPDIVPADAVLYIECTDLPRNWPDGEAFLQAVRKGPTFRQLPSISPSWRKADVDRKLTRFFDGLQQVREKSGIDPIEAFFGTETAFAYYLPPDFEASGAGEGPKKKVSLSFLFFTRLATLPVRVAALFPGMVVPRALRGQNATYDGSGKYGKITVQRGTTPMVLHFEILRDLLIVSDRAELLERTLALSASEIPVGLASEPLFEEAMENAAPPATSLVRFWGAFDGLDAVWAIRKNAEFKLTQYPYDLVGSILNEIQRDVVDMERTRSLVGWAELKGEGVVSVEGFLLYGGRELAPSSTFRPAEGFAVDAVPGGSMGLIGVQLSVQELWSRLTQGKSSKVQKYFGKELEKYRTQIERILPELGPDLAVCFQSHPAAASPGKDVPLPWSAIGVRCRDPLLVSAVLREVFQGLVDKYSKNMKKEPLSLLSETISGVEITSVEGVLKGVRDSICPDFSPGFATWRDLLIIFTAKNYAFGIIEATGGTKPPLGQGETFKGIQALRIPQANFSVYLDQRKIADAVAQPQYRMGIARVFHPLDHQRWEEINAEIKKKHGDLPPAELKRLKDAKEAEIQGAVHRTAANLSRNAAIMKILKALDVSGLYLTDPQGQPTGLHARLNFQFETGTAEGP